MLFKSPNDPDAKSTQQLVIFCHADERVLLPLPHTYEEAVQTVREEFSLSGSSDIIFETEDLLGADRPHVRIHPRAWDGISTLLRCIYVTISKSPRRPAPASPASSTASVPQVIVRPRVSLAGGAYTSTPRRASTAHSQKRISLVDAASKTGSKPQPPAERQSLSARKAPLSSSGARPSSIVSFHALQDFGMSAGGTSPAVAVRERPPSPVFVESARIEELRDDDESAGVPEIRNAHADTMEEEEEEEDAPIRSPTKKRSTRPRVLSDYGLEDVADEEQDDGEEDHSKTRDEDEDEDEEFDQLELDEPDYASAGPSRSKVKSQPQSQSQPKSNGPPRTDASALFSLDERSSNSAARSKVKVENPAPVRQLDPPPPPPSQIRVKTEKPSTLTFNPALAKSQSQRKPSSQLARSASSSQPPTASSKPKRGADESFLVMIAPEDEPDTGTLFKTRGRHTVAKVLMQACRTFELEEFFQSARLVLVVEEEDEDGELVAQRRTVCNRNGTMAEAGAHPDARFILEIEEDSV